MNLERVKSILLTKEKSEDFVHKYVLTPTMKDLRDCDIIEARGAHSDCISIYSFCDTRDKKVITLAHLGYDYDYNIYCPLTAQWSSNDHRELEDIDFSELFELGRALREMHTVWLVSVKISGKGRNYSDVADIKDTDSVNEAIKNGYDFVLFVFDLD
jgi:hypothetical protein